MMTLLKAFGIGIIIWFFGVCIFITSYYIPLSDNLDLQANIALSVGKLPIIWFGSKLFYTKSSAIKGYLLGLVFFITAAILDALFTVHYLIIPNG